MEQYINPRTLKPGDVVTLYQYNTENLEKGRILTKIRAQVVAKYPYYVHFRMAAGYSQCFSYWALERMLNKRGIEGETDV